MNNILKSVSLDHKILKGNYLPYLGVYVIAAAIGILLKFPGITTILIMVFSAPIVGLYFQQYEKNNLSKLYGILPIARDEVVIGRYLYGLIYGVANLIASAIVDYAIQLVTQNPLSQVEFLAYTFIPFLYFCLYIAFQFPIYFKFNFSKVYIYSNLPMYILLVGGQFVLRKTDFLAQLNQLIQSFTTNPNLIWIECIGGGLVLLTISCPIAYQLNKSKEL
jgi:hypothetical protein